VQALVRNGHRVTVFHRGDHEPDLPSSVHHIHGRFEQLGEFRSEFRRVEPDVVLDMVPYIDKNGHGISHFRGIAERAVVISSGDVYRAFARLWRSEPGVPDPVPLREDAPLRSSRAPDRSAEHGFDNLDAERAARAEPAIAATILRLPATHGPGDPQRRLARYVRAMEDGRPAIVLGETQARWRWSRGYVENVAAAIALAVGDRRAAGRTYNVAAPTALSEADWIRAVAAVAEWGGEVRIVRDEQLPVALRRSFDFEQHLELDTTAIRAELGFREAVSEADGLRRTVEWERGTLADAPDLRLDYSAEDEVLAVPGSGD
jgi:nucleoside-diphosphate-sugar epimerase